MFQDILISETSQTQAAPGSSFFGFYSSISMVADHLLHSIPLRQIRQTMSFRIETFTQNHCFQSQLESTKSSKRFSEMKNQYRATGVTFTNCGGGPWLWKGFRPERASSATNGEKSPNSKILRRMKRALFTASCQTIKTKKSLRGSFLIFFYDH